MAPNLGDLHKISGRDLSSSSDIDAIAKASCSSRLSLWSPRQDYVHSVAVQKKSQLENEIVYNDIMVEVRCKEDYSCCYYNNVIFGTLAKGRYVSIFLHHGVKVNPIPVVTI